jgi:hypothetical protein
MKKLCLVALLSLSCCSAYNNKFDCPYGDGLGCTSVSKVNRMIDQNQIPLDDEPKAKARKVLVYYGPNKMSQMIEVE